MKIGKFLITDLAFILYGMSSYIFLNYYINSPKLPKIFSIVALSYTLASYLALLIFKKQYENKVKILKNRTFLSDCKRIIDLKNNKESYLFFIFDIFWRISIVFVVGMGISASIVFYIGFKLKGL